MVWELVDSATQQLCGDAYFEHLVSRLSAVLGASVGFVGELDGNTAVRVRTHACLLHGKSMPSFEYELSGTPCERVVREGVCWLSSGVDRDFAANEFIARHSIRSYVGVPLFSGKRELLGLLVFMHDAPMPESAELKALLQICASRLGLELERARMQHQLSTSEARLQASIESTPHVAVQWYDSDGVVRLWNKASEELYGFSADEMVGKATRNLLLSDEDNRRFSQAIAQVTSTNAPVGPLIFDIRRRDGTLRHSESMVFGIPGEQGRTWFVCMDVDVTARRSAERNLRTTETQYSHLIDSSPLPMLVTDLNERVLLGNAKFAEIFGYSLEDVADIEAWWPMVYPDPAYRVMVRQEWVSRIASARQTGQSTDPMEVELRCKDGGIRRVQMSASVCSDRLLIVFNDFTERTRLENELRHAQKLEVVGQLAGGVAHDFNNIIQGVLGFIGLAQDPTLSNADRDLFLREAMGAAKRASQLTRQLLAFGRRQAMHMEDTHVPDLVSNLLKLLRRLIGEHIEVSYQPAQEIGNVHCDRTQIEQVLINLCVNARDAMPKGGRISIRIENCTLSPAFKHSNPWARIGRFVLLSVEDNGCGMDKLTQERVFEPFFTTKPKDKGSGLGLAVVYGIVRQHEGMIRLQSEVGQGTTFRIYLPVIDSAKGGNGATASAGQAAPVQGGSETILIAEDDDTIRTLIRKILERAGYQVISAANGQEAVELFEAHRARIALLVFDAVMPKLSGFEAFERIRQIAPAQALPVVFASGYNDAFSQGGGLPKDAIFIQKPYDPDELLRRIRLILGAASCAARKV